MENMDATSTETMGRPEAIHALKRAGDILETMTTDWTAHMQSVLEQSVKESGKPQIKKYTPLFESASIVESMAGCMNQRENELRRKGILVSHTSVFTALRVRARDQVSTETIEWRTKCALAEIEYSLYERADALTFMEVQVTHSLALMKAIHENVQGLEGGSMMQTLRACGESAKYDKEQMDKAVECGACGLDELDDEFENCEVIRATVLASERKHDRRLWFFMAEVARWSGKKIARQMTIPEFFHRV